MNKIIRKEIAKQVIESLFAKDTEVQLISIGELRINYFSIVFEISIELEGSIAELFIKIPKADLRNGEDDIFPLTLLDKEMGKSEVNSLLLLRAIWKKNQTEIQWVELIGFLEDKNAIVTKKISGIDVIHRFRSEDIFKRLLFKNSKTINTTMTKLGSSLGRMHSYQSNKKVFRYSHELPKINNYCQKIIKTQKLPTLKKIISKLNSYKGRELPSNETNTLKGLDLRNVLINEACELFLLDPGKIKLSFPESDVARFFITYRMLHWGTLKMLLLSSPSISGEKVFLKNYSYQNNKISSEILSFFCLKEILKMWVNIIDTVHLKNWPLMMKKFVLRFYVTPIFMKLIHFECRAFKNKIN